MRERCVGCAEVISQGNNVDCVGASAGEADALEFLLGCAEYGTSLPEPGGVGAKEADALDVSLRGKGCHAFGCAEYETSTPDPVGADAEEADALETSAPDPVSAENSLINSSKN